MQFIDHCKIKIKAGDGGNGVIAWRKESHCPYGGPYGGNGGNGGNVYICGTHNCYSLWHLKNAKHIIAKNGINGATKVAHGADADDIIINVPLGTIVIDFETKQIIAEVLVDQEIILLAAGGKGGKGNFHFKSSVTQSPACNERGELGEQKILIFEIQLIAHVGFFGLPNAGKSTLLKQISNASPKVADYPFTTLVPVLGVATFKEKKLTFADIPGIIENAHQGSGLGHDFLKHINRCQILIHLISANPEDGSALKNYEIIMKEIKEYSQEIVAKKKIIVLNKSDLNPNILELQNQLIETAQNDVFVISALKSVGINSLLSTIFKWFEEHPEHYSFVSKININKDLIFEKKGSPVEIKMIDGQWRIEHPIIKYWVHRIPFTTLDNCWRLKQKLKKFNLNKKISDLNIPKNSIISLYGLIFIYGADNCPWN